MTFLSRRKRQTTVRATTTRKTTACKWFATALLLGVAGTALAQGPAQTPGQVRSSFVPRDGGTPPVSGPETKPAPPPITPSVSPIIRAQATITAPKSTTSGAESVYVRLDPPGRDKLFGTRETEKQLEERMRQEAKDAGLVDSVLFPVLESSTETYKPRQFAPMVAITEPSYVIYRRLYFEEKNAERNAWNFGYFQPLVSSAYFFKDCFFFPHNFASDMCRRFETNAGECLPGNSLPYMIYPPEITLSGSAFEAAVIIGTAVIFIP